MQEKHALLRKWTVWVTICVLPTTSHSASFAEFGYTLFNGQCPKSRAIQLDSEPSCVDAAETDSRVVLLKKDFGEISENTFLALLAEQRGLALACARNQASELMAKPESQKQVVDDIAAKLILLMNQKRQMTALQPAVGLKSLTPSGQGLQPGTDAFKYNQARLGAEAIVASIPFAQTQTMRNLVNGIASQELGEDELDQNALTSIKDSVKAALPSIKRELAQSASVMENGASTMGRSLDDRARESLAQDTDLIESFRQKNPSLAQSIKPVACHVNAKYGKGAQYRDNALMVASVLGAGLGVTALRFGAAKLAAQVTGAAANGTFSLRAAGILRVIAAATESAVPLDQAYSSCYPGAPTLGTASSLLTGNKNQCESSVLTSLHQDNCALNLALALLGVTAISQMTKDAFSVIRSPPSLKKYFTPTNKTSVTAEQISHSMENVKSTLHDMGVGFVQDARPTYAHHSVTGKWNTIDEASGTTLNANNSGSLLRVTSLPPPSSANYLTNALQHPEMADYMRKMKTQGYDLVVDPSIENTGVAAYILARPKVIGLTPNSTWQVFQHEYQHLQFNEFIQPRIQDLRDLVATKGRSIRDVLPASIQSQYGERELDRLESLLKKEHTDLGVNESLSTGRELDAMGWKRYLPGLSSTLASDAAKHRVTSLTELRERGVTLSETQLRALRESKTQVILAAVHENSLIGVVGAPAITGLVVIIKNLDGSFSTFRDRPIVYNIKTGDLLISTPDGDILRSSQSP